MNANETSAVISYAINEITTADRGYDAILDDPTEDEENQIHAIAKSAIEDGTFKKEEKYFWAGCETDLIHTSYDDARARGEIV